MEVRKSRYKALRMFHFVQRAEDALGVQVESGKPQALPLCQLNPGDHRLSLIHLEPHLSRKNGEV